MWGKEKERENGRFEEGQQADKSSSYTAAQPEMRTEPLMGSSAEHRSGTVIGSSVVLNGEMSAAEDILVQGQVEGKVNLKNNTFTVGKEGKVKATIDAKKIDVQGRVDGDMNSSDLVMIHETGRATGNIVANRVVLKDGCRFRGSIEMDMEDAKA